MNAYREEVVRFEASEVKAHLTQAEPHQRRIVFSGVGLLELGGRTSFSPSFWISNLIIPPRVGHVFGLSGHVRIKFRSVPKAQPCYCRALKCGYHDTFDHEVHRPVKYRVKMTV